MRAKSTAADIVRAMLGEPGSPLQLVICSCDEYELGWVFGYNTAEFVDHGVNALEGNRPIFVPADGTAPQYLNGFRPIREHLEAFAACGDANARRSASVRIVGCADNPRRDQAALVVVESTSLSLGRAKQLLSKCMAGATETFVMSSVDAAMEMVARLEETGFRCEVPYSSGIHTRK